MSAALLRAAELLGIHDASVAQWQSRPPDEVTPSDDLASLVTALHVCNFTLWGLEDEARRSDRGDAHVASMKRAIDACNQRRSDLVERIDESVLDILARSCRLRGPQHSETAGMIVDRLSILALKIHNMRLHAGRGDDPSLAAECARKAAVLEEQRRDLAACYDTLIDDCLAGRRHFKVYRQYKAYNDPRLSPAELGKARASSSD